MEHFVIEDARARDAILLTTDCNSDMLVYNSERRKCILSCGLILSMKESPSDPL